MDNLTLLSSVHGRDRRSLRDIGKRDLLKAVLYGVKERETFEYVGMRYVKIRKRHSYEYSNGGIKLFKDEYQGEELVRWKYTFQDIVYITDADSRHEITSWVVPIEVHKVSESADDIFVHNKLAQRLRDDPSQCTSHTVLVIDQSGSMKTCDVADFKTRSHAV